jgi:hypothetical protein
MTQQKARQTIKERISNDGKVIDDLVEKVAAQLRRFVEGGSKRLIAGSTQEVYLIPLKEENMEVYRLMERIGLIENIREGVLLIDLYGHTPFRDDVCSLTPEARRIYEVLTKEKEND